CWCVWGGCGTKNTGAKRVFFKEIRHDAKGTELAEKNMLFGRNDISGNVGMLVTNWLNMSASSDLSVFCNLYSSVTRTREQYLDKEFLTLAQAVEIYHRARFNNYVLPKDEWKKKIQLILNQISNKVEQQWLKEKLCWSNAPTLQSRLEDILCELEPATSLLVSDKKGFAELVKHTRNYFTHWDTKGKKQAASYSDLYFVSGTLRYLLAACLLRELGFDSEKTAELFKRNIQIDKFRRNSDNIIAFGEC
ncbi:MAG: hypothetical protein D3924_19355, partial [Candidatus Electrothrix sp. AR4]|nr:hypothetical protein [Candidatus Electrothrix sp. AR4]